MRQEVSFRAAVQRKQPELPRFVVVGPQHLPGRTKSVPAEIYLNRVGPFPRNIHPWGKGSPDFFFNLTEPQCRKAGLDTGDTCLVTIVLPAA